MTDFIRGIVSGDKARFKDSDLDVDLDLVYITHQLIVMGYPASGLEALYRNSREDATKFLEHRHGKNFWVFNFCPIKENSYPSSVFDDRVSRYPFPDHHAPPLAYLALVAREIRTWLDGSPNHVAVLHCKAGKGRSGTMACAYLLALDSAPSPPRLEQSHTAIERATSHAEQLMDAMPSDEVAGEYIHKEEDITSDASALAATSASAMQNKSPGDPSCGSQPKPSPHSLNHVLELHSSRRMKRPSSPSKKPKQGVSIPSQRRWLYYWSLLLVHQGPPGFWPTGPEATRHPAPKVRLTQITLRMRELSGMKTNLVRAANAIIERTSFAKAPGINNDNADSRGQVWVSLARYDDELIALLERRERNTRDEADMGRSKLGADRTGDEALADIFKSDRWDKGKMVLSFARLGMVGKESIQKEVSQTDGKVITRVLRPLTDDKWGVLHNSIQVDAEEQLDEAAHSVEPEETFINDVTQTLKGGDGIVLNANREVRVKLFMGQVFMGWFWFIPTFHMSHSRAATGQSTALVLQRKDLDFPIGIGSSIVDVKVSLEWMPEATDSVGPPSREGNLASRQGPGEPAGIAASLHVVTADRFTGVMETKQAAED